MIRNVLEVLCIRFDFLFFGIKLLPPNMNEWMPIFIYRSETNIDFACKVVIPKYHPHFNLRARFHIR